MIAIHSRRTFKVLFARFFITSMTTLLVISSHAAEPAKEKPGEEKIYKITDDEIKKLVEQLVSPNKAPDVVAFDPGYPKGYDHEAQKKIEAACSSLSKLGPQAFPFLIDHFDDKGYCITVDFNSYENRDVGFVCKWLFYDHLIPLGDKVAGDGYTSPAHVDIAIDEKIGPRGTRTQHPDYFELHKLRDLKELKKWAIERRDRSLREIQIDIIKWTIEEEKKDKKKFSNDEIEFLQKQLSDLEKSKKPLQPKKGLSAK
jgi:hypothetical protein